MMLTDETIQVNCSFRIITIFCTFPLEQHLFDKRATQILRHDKVSRWEFICPFDCLVYKVFDKLSCMRFKGNTTRWVSVRKKNILKSSFGYLGVCFQKITYTLLYKYLFCSDNV